MKLSIYAGPPVLRALEGFGPGERSARLARVADRLAALASELTAGIPAEELAAAVAAARELPYSHSAVKQADMLWRFVSPPELAFRVARWPLAVRIACCELGEKK